MKLLRSRLLFGSGACLVVILVLIALVPSETAKLALVVVGMAGVVPLLTLGLLHRAAHRTRSENREAQANLIGQIQDLQAAQDKLARELIDAIEDGRRRSEHRLDEGLSALRDDVRQFRQELAAHTAQPGSDQQALASNVLRTSGSATLVHAGTGTADFCAQLDLDGSVVVDLNERPTVSTVDVNEVDSLLVVAGSRADLRWITGVMESWPVASRVLVAVLRSGGELPFPTMALPPDDDLARVHLHRGDGHGWTADIVLHRPGPTEVYVRSLARMAGIKPSSVSDIRLINPVGFRSDPTEGIAQFAVGDADDLLITSDDRAVLRIPADVRLTEADIVALRPFRGVAVDGCVTSPGHAVLPLLAAAGIPLCATRLPDGLRHSADARLISLIESATPESLRDPLAREEHSVRLRRLGLRSLDLLPASPALSVIMCTRREDMIAFALEQLGRQRGVDFEVVLGLHGEWPTAASVMLRAQSELANCTTVRIPAEVPFGEAVNRLAKVASGSVLLKMDDDDWYGPDFVADLLLARSYSEADIVGSAAEFIFLEERDITVRRSWGTEVFGHNVSGNSLMIDRAAFEAVNGFRALDTSGNDTIVQEDVRRAGGSIYRSHGLNFVVRRRPSGHTWQESSDYFLESPAQTWPGLFLPSFVRAD